jgi:NTE family protein
LLRHLFRGLGATGERGLDLLSYLAFDGEYTSRLIALGYADVQARSAEISAFFGICGGQSELPSH